MKLRPSQSPTSFCHGWIRRSRWGITSSDTLEVNNVPPSVGGRMIIQVATDLMKMGERRLPSQ